MAAEGGVSSAESTDDDDFTTNTESEDEQDEDLGSCDEAAVAHAEHLQAAERAVRFATKLARRLVKAWLWHDKTVMEAAVRQLPHVLVTRQVVFASGHASPANAQGHPLECTVELVQEQSGNPVLGMAQEAEGGEGCGS